MAVKVLQVINFIIEVFMYICSLAVRTIFFFLFRCYMVKENQWIKVVEKESLNDFFRKQIFRAKLSAPNNVNEIFGKNSADIRLFSEIGNDKSRKIVTNKNLSLDPEYIFSDQYLESAKLLSENCCHIISVLFNMQTGSCLNHRQLHGIKEDELVNCEFNNPLY